MSTTYLPVLFENGEFLVSWGGGQKKLTNQITIYEYSNGGYTNLGSLGQNNKIKTNFVPKTYFVKSEDVSQGLGGRNRTKRHQYRYRFSSKKRVASHRGSHSRGRGRQTRYSRRK
jgi:hypothetical protein